MTTTAQTQYKTRQARIQALMQQLQTALARHESKAATEPGNWGYAGDLGRVETGLQELVEFFQN